MVFDAFLSTPHKVISVIESPAYCILYKDAKHKQQKYLAQHTLIGNNPQRKVIHLKRMILPINHFRRHITRRPRRILKILLLHHPCNPHICQPQVPLLVNYDILRLYIAMTNS